MNVILDAASDLSLRRAYQIRQLYTLPEFAKTATLEDLAPAADTAGSCFGLPRQRKFASHTPAATWWNTAYFLQQSDLLTAAEREMVDARLAKAAAFWEIQDEVGRLRDEHAQAGASRTKAAGDAAYGLVYRDAQGQVQRRLYLGTAADVGRSADWLIKHAYELPFAPKREAARRTLAAAEDLGVVLDDPRAEALQKQAGLGCSTPEQVAALLRNRSVLANGELKVELYKAAEAAAHDAALAADVQALNKTAEQLDALDEQFQWRRYYGTRLTAPEELFCVTRTKLAALDRDLLELPTGSVYSRAQLGSLTLREVEDFLGTAVAGKVANWTPADGRPELDVDLLEPLLDDPPLAEAFDRLMQKRAEAPVLKLHQPALVSPSRTTWQRLATAYVDRLAPSSAVHA